ncbi:type IV secretion system protein [Rhizobium sp. TRM95111]|uniref:type IV secretion system protein n=1 Tax=Rhizobium alarense TaxID=2846851 RepID=UPI001F3EF48F|nr:type IV secretion system protein [Rhizobium alarense]MCF3642948.1 type IV secretion system protein [Rhizobium alarense]
MATDVMLFTFIGETINSALESYVTAVTSDVISMIAATAVIAGGIYYAFIGTLMALGRLDGPFSHLMLSVFKYLIIAAIALNVSNYNGWVVTSIRGMETAFATAFAGNNGADPGSIYETIDKALQDGWDLGAVLWERGAGRGITEISLGLSEIVLSIGISIATMVIALPAGAMVIASKAVITLLLAIGPLFVLALGWSVTKGFFDRWFGAIITTVLQLSLLSAVLALAIKMFQYVVSQIDVDSPTGSTLFAALTIVGMTVVMLYLLYRVYDLGAQLGGGISAAAITFGGMAAQASGLARAPGNLGRAVGQMVNPASTRRDLESGMMVTAGRLNHLSAGNTMWNPKYRQHVAGQFGKNWGRARGGGVEGQ